MVPSKAKKSPGRRRKPASLRKDTILHKGLRSRYHRAIVGVAHVEPGIQNHGISRDARRVEKPFLEICGVSVYERNVDECKTGDGI
jgi:hypothetical protein